MIVRYDQADSLCLIIVFRRTLPTGSYGIEIRRRCLLHSYLIPTLSVTCLTYSQTSLAFFQLEM
jgi:hypothetical protein